jgi:molybdate transport repressor ModE-like protein
VRYLGIAYPTAWLLVQEISETLQKPPVTTTQGGANGSGAAVTPVGDEVVKLYRSIEGLTGRSTHQERLAIGRRVPQVEAIPTQSLLNKGRWRDISSGSRQHDS